MRSAILVVALASMFVLPTQTVAHPGGTASDGCHYCRTNCDKWGVPWNERHCHNGHSPNAEALLKELAAIEEEHAVSHSMASKETPLDQATQRTLMVRVVRE